MRVVGATVGTLLLLIGQYCALNAIWIAFIGSGTRSYGFVNPWP